MFTKPVGISIKKKKQIQKNVENNTFYLFILIHLKIKNYHIYIVFLRDIAKVDNENIV